MSQSEVARHKVYEHPVPVLPFEEKKGFDANLSKNNSNTDTEDLQKMTSNVIITGKANHNNDTTPIGGTLMRKVSFRTFRV